MRFLILHLVLNIICIFHVVKAITPQLDDTWAKYKERFNKHYDDEEDQQRRETWELNLKNIVEHNIEYELGLTSFKKGVNPFTDLNHEEFNRIMNGYKPDNGTARLHGVVPRNTFGGPRKFKLPDTVDWREEGVVTPVKDQRQCGSCWAFITTGALEAQTKKKTGKLVSLSEQNLIDCSQAEGNHGCNGGSVDATYNYIKKNGGIDTEESYPYEDQDGTCRFKKESIGATVKGLVDIRHGSEKDLQVAVATVGPVSVAIDAGSWNFQFYAGGVYDEPSCSNIALNHGVLVVGYGTEHGKDYWLAKNSWGTTWGIDGYVKMSRNKENQCGIATLASYPVV